MYKTSLYLNSFSVLEYHGLVLDSSVDIYIFRHFYFYLCYMHEWILYHFMDVERIYNKIVNDVIFT